MGARKRARLADELTQAAGCCRSQHQNIKRLFSSTSREADKRTGWRGADRRYRSAERSIDGKRGESALYINARSD